MNLEETEINRRISLDRLYWEQCDYKKNYLLELAFGFLYHSETVMKMDAKPFQGSSPDENGFAIT